MAKRASNFPNGASDDVVLAWMRRVGVDPNLVHGYTLERGPAESMITLKCWFEDGPVEPETVPYDTLLRVRDARGWLWARQSTGGYVCIEPNPEADDEPVFSCLAELANARGSLSYA